MTLPPIVRDYPFSNTKMGNIQSFQEHFAGQFADQISRTSDPTQLRHENASNVPGIIEDLRNMFESNQTANISFTDNVVQMRDIVLEMIANKKNIVLMTVMMKKHNCEDLIGEMLTRNFDQIDFKTLIHLSALLNEDEKETIVKLWIEKNQKRGYDNELLTDNVIETICNDSFLLSNLLFSKKNIETIFKRIVGINSKSIKISNPVNVIKILDKRIISNLERERLISRFMILRDEEQFEELIGNTPLDQETLEVTLWFIPEHVKYFVGKGLQITTNLIRDLLEADLIRNVLFLYHHKLITPDLHKIVKRDVQLIDSKLCPYIDHVHLDGFGFFCSICLTQHESQIKFSCPENAEAPASYCFLCAEKCKFTCATCKKPMIVGDDAPQS